ncbi:MAG: hypothetical protein IPF93_00210 [Saprospiraceae bacterium]|nr:hypothetical protein [Saprospiraceae bacterium]
MGYSIKMVPLPPFSSVTTYSMMIMDARSSVSLTAQAILQVTRISPGVSMTLPDGFSNPGYPMRTMVPRPISTNRTPTITLAV